MEEIWKDIEGYEGLYQVSNEGRVKSLKYGKERILKAGNNGRGYYTVALYKDGKGKYCQIHRLVAKAFIPNPEGLPCINHKDENPANNRVENLEWCTYKYNNNYGTKPQRIRKAHKGKEHSEEHKKNLIKSHEKMVMGINKENRHIFIFNSIKQASEELGINRGNISKCCKGKRKQCGGYYWSYY